MLFLMRGASCSGKDRMIAEHFEPHTVLSSDWYRKVLTNDIENQQQNGQVFEAIHDLLEKRLKNRLPYTVVNATHLKMKSIAEPLALAEKYGEKVTVISIDPPDLDELKRRAFVRGQEGGLKTPDEVLERHWTQYYTSMPAFMERAVQGFLGDFTFVRVDQNQEFVSESLYEVRERVYEISRERQ